VVLDGGFIGTDPTGAEVVDADGGVLIPGLIDAHVHLSGRESLDLLCSFGVTTALVMASWPPPLTRGLQGLPGTTDTRSSGTPAVGAGGPQARIPGMGQDAVVNTPEEASAFVEARLAEGADYLKIVVEAPGRGGPDRATVSALVLAAHRRGLRVVAHAAQSGAVLTAMDVADAVQRCTLDRHGHRRSGAPANPTSTHLTWTDGLMPATKLHPADSGIRRPTQRPGSTSHTLQSKCRQLTSKNHRIWSIRRGRPPHETSRSVTRASSSAVTTLPSGPGRSKVCVASSTNST